MILDIYIKYRQKTENSESQSIKKNDFEMQDDLTQKLQKPTTLCPLSLSIFKYELAYFHAEKK